MVLGIILLIISYLIGSIPFGYLLGKSKGKDIREQGSGNIGSTNVTRTLGVKFGAIAMICDLLKGALIILIVYLLEATTNWNSPFVINGESLYILYGLAAVVGHVFPVFLKFKGGKAVATTMGAFAVTFPIAALVGLIVFILLILISGFVSLASTFGGLVGCITSIILYGGGVLDNQLISSLITIIFVLLIALRPIENYKRLLNGTEHSFKKNKHKK